MYKSSCRSAPLSDTMPDGKTRQQDMIDAINNLKAPGSTPACTTRSPRPRTRSSPTSTPDATNLVVLMTDGQDVGSSMDLNALKVKLTKNRQTRPDGAGRDHRVRQRRRHQRAQPDLSHIGTISLAATNTFDINQVLLGALFGTVEPSGSADRLAVGAACGCAAPIDRSRPAGPADAGGTAAGHAPAGASRRSRAAPHRLRPWRRPRRPPRSASTTR